MSDPGLGTRCGPSRQENRPRHPRNAHLPSYAVASLEVLSECNSLDHLCPKDSEGQDRALENRLLTGLDEADEGL